MSINSEAYVKREWLDREGSITSPAQPPRVTNGFFSRQAFVNPFSVAFSGKYENTVKLPEPIRAWHRASKGTVDEFRGCLTEIFPELKDLSEEELEEIGKMRDKV